MASSQGRADVSSLLIFSLPCGRIGKDYDGLLRLVDYEERKGDGGRDVFGVACEGCEMEGAAAVKSPLKKRGGVGGGG